MNDRQHKLCGKAKAHAAKLGLALQAMEFGERHGNNETAKILSILTCVEAVNRVEKTLSRIYYCPHCGGGHPPGCCAQDGHGG